MAHTRAQIRRVGAFLLLAIAMLSVPSTSYAVGGCANISLVCVGCDNDEQSQINCCIPKGCNPVEVESGGCGGPAVCEWVCNGKYSLHLYACPS